MQLKYDELAAGRYDVQCDEKPLEHVLFADEEEGYCLLGATDLQGNLLPASDPDTGYPYDTVRVQGTIRITERTSALASAASLVAPGSNFFTADPAGPDRLVGGPNLFFTVDPAAPNLLVGGPNLLVVGGPKPFAVPETTEPAVPLLDSFFSQLQDMPVFTAVRLRKFGQKLDLKEADFQREAEADGGSHAGWAREMARRMGQAMRERQNVDVAGSLGLCHPVAPPPAPHLEAQHVRHLLRLRGVPGRAGQFTVEIDENVSDCREYRLVSYAVFDADLELTLEDVENAPFAFCRHFRVKSPQFDVQLHREHVPLGPPAYDPDGHVVAAPLEAASRVTLRLSPGALYLGPLAGQEHWEMVEHLLGNLIDCGAPDDDEEDGWDEEEDADEPGDGA